MNETNDYFIKSTYKKFLTPTILALSGTTFSSFGNTLLAGYFLGKKVLSAMNILSSFTFLFAMLGCLISVGAAANASIAIGKGAFAKAGRYEWLAFVFSLSVPFVISVPCLIGFDSIFAMLGADAGVFQIGAVYGRIVVGCGFLNTFMYFPFNFLRLIGKGRYGMYSFGAMGILDVALVYLFLRLGMGVTGVALGYVLSMLAANAAGLFFLLKKNEFFRMARPRRDEIRKMTIDVVSFGGAAGLNNLCKTVRTTVMNLLIAKYLGNDGLQSLAVGCSIINLASASVTGFGQAASPIIGVLFGERDRKGQRQAVKISQLYSLIFHIVIAALIFIFASPIVRAFGITGDIHIANTVLLVRLVAISFIPASMVNIFIYYYTAIGENKGAMLLTVMHGVVLVWVLCAVHLAISPSEWYGMAFITAELLDVLVMLLYSIARRKKDTSLKGMLLERSDYAEKFFSTVSDGSEDGAVSVSEQVVSFCEQNSVSPALCMKLPLVVEELVVLLGRHCSTDNGSQIDIRISLVSEKVLMRMRCEGAIFNPVEWYQEKKRTLSEEEFMMDECFGMGVVENLVRDVKYTSIFGVNNLIVTMSDKKALV